MKIPSVFKVAVALSVFFVGMEMAVSAEPPSVKAQAASKKHSSFASGKADNASQTSQQMPTPLLPSGDNVTTLRVRIARGEKFVERILPEIKTPEIFSTSPERDPSRPSPGH